MSTIQEIAISSSEDIEARYVTKDDRETINVLENLLREIRGNGVTNKVFSEYTANELSIFAGDIAAYKANLSLMMSKILKAKLMHEEILNARLADLRKGTIEKLKLELGGKTVSETALKERMRKITFNTKVRLIELGSKYEYYLYLWRASNHMCDMIQSRINVLISDRADTKFNNGSYGFDEEAIQEMIGANSEEEPTLEPDQAPDEGTDSDSAL